MEHKVLVHGERSGLGAKVSVPRADGCRKEAVMLPKQQQSAGRRSMKTGKQEQRKMRGRQQLKKEEFRH